MSPISFNIVLESLSREFRCDLSWDLLYADDLDLMAESEGNLMEKFELWRSGMEDKGLRVNMDRTKILVCRAKLAQSGKSSDKWSCGVCGKGVGRNSIHCTQCGKWIHKRCSGVKGSSESCKNFKCLNVVASVEMSDSQAKSAIVGLESVDTFCYLGDMLI